MSLSRGSVVDETALIEMLEQGASNLCRLHDIGNAKRHRHNDAA
ncbi:hypothetical protein [Pseudomonas sp. RIT-PI-q]